MLLGKQRIALWRPAIYAGTILFFLSSFAALHPAFALVSVPPLAGLVSSGARQAVLSTAESYLGTRYRYGGSSKSGIDCSGLVYVSFLKATGVRIPRSVDALSKWVLIIPKNELEPGDLVFFSLEAKTHSSSKNPSTNVSVSISTSVPPKTSVPPVSPGRCLDLMSLSLTTASIPSSPSSILPQTSVPPKTSVPPNLSDSSILAFSLSKADHVGIYLGDDIFIHAASTGAKTGVIRSSLRERSWQQRFLFAGRALPASGFSGFALDWGSGISFAQLDMLLQGDLLAFVRGISGWTEVSLPVANNLSAGLRAGVQWDRVLGVVRVPIELDLGRISGVSVFAGPAITFGLPTLNGRLYTQGDFFLATGGLRWSSFFYSRGAHRLGSYIELRYDYYVPKPEQVESIRSDLQSCLNISIGFRLRNVFY